MPKNLAIALLVGLLAASAIGFAVSQQRTADVEVRIWQSTSTGKVYWSARAAGGSWSTLGTNEATFPEVNERGTFRYEDIDVAVPLPDATKVPTPTPEPTATPESSVTAKQLLKNPDGFIGRPITVYAEILQFNTATGLCGFHAQISDKRSNNYRDYEGRVSFGYSNAATDSARITDCPALDNVYEITSSLLSGR